VALIIILDTSPFVKTVSRKPGNEERDTVSLEKPGFWRYLVWSKSA